MVFREQERRLNNLTADKIRRFETFTGDAQSVLSPLPPRICRTWGTNPLYWRKMDYKHPEQLGWEKMPEQFVSRRANIFDGVNDASEVKKVEDLRELRRELSAKSGSDYYSRWAGWLFAGNRARTTSSLFDLTGTPSDSISAATGRRDSC